MPRVIVNQDLPHSVRLVAFLVQHIADREPARAVAGIHQPDKFCLDGLRNKEPEFESSIDGFTPFRFFLYRFNTFLVLSEVDVFHF